MTEKKISPEKEAAPEQGEKKVKATTGAWWKSSVADEAENGGRQEQASALSLRWSQRPSPPEKNDQKTCPAEAEKNRLLSLR